MGTLVFPDVPFSGTLYEDVESFVTTLERGAPLLDFDEIGRLARMDEDLETSIGHLQMIRTSVKEVIKQGVFDQRQDEYERREVAS